MSETTEIQTNTDLGDPEYIRATPGSLRLIEGVQVVGRFIRLERAPFDTGYGIPWIAVFGSCHGMISDRDGDAVTLDPDATYGLWLIHGMATSGLKALRPANGERVAMLYEGRKPSRKRVDANGNPVKYHAYKFVCPDRPVVEQPAGDWDTVESDDTPDF